MEFVEERFSNFYENWLSRLQRIFFELLQVTRTRNMEVANDSRLLALVSIFTSHLSEFYFVKLDEAYINSLVFICPTWLTNFERSQLWISGFKPTTMVFRLLDSMRAPQAFTLGLSMPPFILTLEQQVKIEELRRRNLMDEENVDIEIDRILKSIDDRKIVDLVKISQHLSNNNINGVLAERLEELVEFEVIGTMSEFASAIVDADCVRLRSVNEVLNVLSPMQCVQFLAKFIHLVFLNANGSANY
ncbi:hypothetical protein L6164_037331 [Bauhinia variegata]|uniref:Uncharacterized protein n=1 Tax=Bauhinia variegata TaxID=167791 RepID=A0ACB9KJZ7_BAUVA|nr:hypothetical protein L6164_037331 [Bauhinia variegata]